MDAEEYRKKIELNILKIMEEKLIKSGKINDAATILKQAISKNKTEE